MGDALAQAQGIGYPQAVVPALATAALIECLEGNPSRARELCHTVDPARLNCVSPIAEICRILVACDSTEHARTLLDSVHDGPARLLNNVASGRALLAQADGDHTAADRLYEDAAMRWRAYDCPYEIAHTLAGRACSITALGRADAAGALTKEAEKIFRHLKVRHPLVPVV
jgi:hypothetical protein